MEAHQQQQNKPRRATLASVTSERRLPPVRVLIYGPGGVGKTTFASEAKDAIIVSAEDGADYKKVARFPPAEAWQDVLDAIAELRENEHPYKTLVLDSLDWMEQLITGHLCAKHKKESLESFGYGAGYALVFDEMLAFIAKLEKLRRDKQMALVAIAHSTVRTFNNPEGENFDRYELKLQSAKKGTLPGSGKSGRSTTCSRTSRRSPARARRAARRARAPASGSCSRNATPRTTPSRAWRCRKNCR